MKKVKACWKGMTWIYSNEVAWVYLNVEVPTCSTEEESAGLIEMDQAC